MDVDRVFDLVQPKGIAVVGASESRYYAGSVLHNLLAGGYDAERIYPVNPRYSRVYDLPCYASLSTINKPLSLVVVVTNRSAVPNVLTEAGALGARAAVVLADGYAEQGQEGRRRQDELLQVARRAGIRLLGPNTLGFVAPPEGTLVWAPGKLRRPLCPGGVGIVFQSSGMLNMFMSLCADRSIGIRAGFSVGNEVGFDTASLISYLSRDPRTLVIVTLLETTTRPQRLVRALREAQRSGKPVVMLKLGMSQRARDNALAHTGRMAGSGRAWQSVLDRLGVVLVSDLDELVEVTSLFDTLPFSEHGIWKTARPAVGVVTVSGGDCGLLSDLSEELHVPLAQLSPETKDSLVSLFDKPSLLGNPLDCENLFKEDSTAFHQAVRTFSSDPEVSVVAFRLYLPTSPSKDIMELYTQLSHYVRSLGKIPVVLSRAIEQLDNAWYDFFASIETAFLPSYRTGLKSIALLCRWWTQVETVGQLSIASVPDIIEQEQVATIASWEATQKLLRNIGVPYAPARHVSTPQEAADAAQELGFPVALKLVSRDVAHKSDIGGVCLNLDAPSDVVSRAREITRQAHAANVSLDGFEVQAMCPSGVEMILGVTRDAVFGPLIVVGMGGIFTELADDYRIALPVLTSKDAEGLICSLTGAPLLFGHRGRRNCDLSAMASATAALSRYVVSSGKHIASLDLNPVTVLPEGDGIIALDALAVINERAPQPIDRCGADPATV